MEKIIKNRRGILFIVLLIFMGMSSASAVVINVPTDYTTIQQAINNASPGDTIYVMNGTYTESLTIDKPLKLMGEGRDVVNLIGPYKPVIEITSSGVKVTGFNISAGSPGVKEGIKVSEGGVVITDNYFYGLKDAIKSEIEIEGNGNYNVGGLAVTGNEIFGGKVEVKVDVEDIHDSSFVSIGDFTFSGNTMNGGDGLKVEYKIGDEEETIAGEPEVYIGDVTVSDNTLIDTKKGIEVKYEVNEIHGSSYVSAGNLTVANNVIDPDDAGIKVEYKLKKIAGNPDVYAGDVIVSGNNLDGAKKGLEVKYEVDTTGNSDVFVGNVSVSRNIIDGQNVHGSEGIDFKYDLKVHGNADLYTGNVSIDKNVIVDVDKEGITIDKLEGGMIYENIIKDSGKEAIKLKGSTSNNYIFRNSFLVDSSSQPEDDGWNNQWWSPSQITYFYNNSTWTNYTGNYYEYLTGYSDSNGDGIYDSSYSGDGYTDDYPLANPWEGGRVVGNNITMFTMTTVGEIEITITNVTDPGATYLDIIDPSQIPSTPPGGFIFFDAGTTAEYSGYIYVIVHYNESNIPVPENQLKIYHYENGAWVDITYTRDPVNNTVTGRTTSLSPFGVGFYISRHHIIAPSGFFRSDQEGLRQRVPVGETATFGIWLKNMDDVNNTVQISYSLDSQTPGDVDVDVPSSVTLLPMEEKNIEVKITPHEEGSFIIHFTAESPDMQQVSYDFVFVVDAFES